MIIKYLITIFLIAFISNTSSEECLCNEINKEAQDLTEYEVEYPEAPPYKKGEPISHQEDRLYRAYLDGSKKKLGDFFVAWADRSKPISEKHLEKLPVAFRHAYKIFEDFYQPKNLGRIGNPEWGTEQFSHVTYFITQPTIRILVTDKVIEEINSNSFTDSIYYAELKNFQPRIKGGTKALFLDDYHGPLIEGFLGSEELPMGHNGIMSTSKAIGESEKKQKFINQYVQIYHGHWGGWRFATDPTISTINFNKSFTKAIVHFSLVYQGGEAIYEYENRKWVLRKSELTWIT